MKQTIKTKIIELPTFEQLSETEQAQVLSNYYDINVDSDWWSCTYEGAKELGIKIESFGLDRNRHCNGKLILNAYEVAELIIADYGETCDVYKLAASFVNDAKKIEKDFFDADCSNDLNFEGEQALEELEAEFTKELLQEYATILQKEYDYLTSETAIKETLILNEYTFNRETLEIDS